MISGAQAMVKCLEIEDTTVVFGYPGVAIAPFYDSLSDSSIRHILTRTEQGAGHAASGYARLNGRVGVCIATSGPGATNLITAIATAYSDSIPLIAITGQVTTSQLGRDVFQEVDTTGAMEPFTKHSYLVKSVLDLPRVFKEAFHIATTGRKGPVLIDVPMDIQQQLFDFAYPASVNIRGYKPKTQGHQLQIRKVAEAISLAKRPLLCCGGGVFLSNATSQIKKLSQQARLPIVTTMMGIGVLPANHANNYGMLGQSGMHCANTAMMESDLIVIIGARVDDRAITSPQHLQANATIVHIDIDSAEIGKNIGASIPLVGDAASVVESITKLNPSGQWGEWLERLDSLKATERGIETALQHPADSANPQLFLQKLCTALPSDVIYVADVGQNQLWSARAFALGGSGRFLTTCGMGTMGYSIPAAMGAKTACLQQMVVAVCGDGSFQMSMNELATMRGNDIPVKIVLMNNAKLGLVNVFQNKNYNKRGFAVDLCGSPDYSLIAAAFGMEYFRVQKGSDCEKGIAQMLASDKSYLLECVYEQTEEIL